MTAKTRTAAIAAAVTAALALPGAASAQTTATLSAGCIENRDTSGTQFDVRLCDVTDIDQFRTGLDANGNAFCGPTSLFNSLMYLATEVGAPIDMGGFKLAGLDPRDPADYGMTTWIDGVLGIKAKYDGGTKMSNLRTAFDDVTASAESKGWSITSGGTDNRDVPDFGAAIAQRQKAAPVQLVYGRYKKVDGYGWQRDGGHIVTVVSVKGNFAGDTIELTLADPGRAPDHGSGNYLNTQSSYQPLKVTLKKTTFTEYYTYGKTEADFDEDGGGSGYGGNAIRTVTRWEAVTAPYTAANTRQMVEGFNWFEAKKTS